MTRPVLVVGYKDSPESRGALETAVNLAAALDADLHVVHVVDLADIPVDPDSADWQERGQETLERIRGDVNVATASLDGRTTYATMRGDAAEVLHDVAEQEGALMIIVGVPAGPASPLSRLFTRSVPHQLTRHIDRPVLLVPDRS